MVEEMLANREGALAFDWTECGKIHEDVCPPVVIKTVSHDTWQEPKFYLPRALIPIVIEMLRDRIKRGILKKYDGPYRNLWFLVTKKVANTYRLINAAMKLNSVTLRDANLPSNVDEFSEEFAGCAVASLVDFFSGYDQLTLDPKSRDMTAFDTPLGLLRMTTPPPGATNSVAQFVRVIMTILEDIFPHIAMPFLDDVGVKGPYTKYDNEEILPGVRHFVFEHIQMLDVTLERLERAGARIGAKSQFCHNGMNIVGFICGYNGRSLASAKIVKIIEWPPCQNTTEAKAFMRICVYYRIWVKDFVIIAEPIYRLLKKGAEWEWGPSQIAAMDTLKMRLTTAPALCKIQYGPEYGLIIVAVDSSGAGWGATLRQRDKKGRKRVSRYESGLWSKAEQKYDATKRECRGVLCAFKKFRYWLYGTHFLLEIDAKVLVAQLNRAATDLPGALVTRWIAWIRLFDFEVVHVKGTKHTAADGLSRRPRTASDDLDEIEAGDIDDWVTMELEYLQIFTSGVEEESAGGGDASNISDQEELPLDDEYSRESQRIAKWLTTLRKPQGMSRKEYRAFKTKATKYSVRDRKLWRNAVKGQPPRLSIDSEERRAELLHSLHDEMGHRGRESTYARLNARYYWDGSYNDVRDYVQSCSECQKASKTRVEEALYATKASGLFTKLYIDVWYPPPCEGKKGLVVCRDDLSGWVEARALSAVNAQSVAKFIWEDVICRHGVFGRMVVDGGGEFKGEVIEILQKYGISCVKISAYNSKANGVAEGGHKPLINALMKLSEGGVKKWTRYLHAVLFADRTSVHGPSGHTPFYLVYGREAVLPVENQVSYLEDTCMG